MQGMCRWTVICAPSGVTSNVSPGKPPSRPCYLDRCAPALTSPHLTLDPHTAVRPALASVSLSRENMQGIIECLENYIVNLQHGMSETT